MLSLCEFFADGGELVGELGDGCFELGGLGVEKGGSFFGGGGLFLQSERVAFVHFDEILVLTKFFPLLAFEALVDFLGCDAM